jgi:Holliday junction resolvasome RuvABC DNA-binding subunit
VLHLKDKLKRQVGPIIEVAEDDADVIAALTSLGFSIVEAQRALQQLPRDAKLSSTTKSAAPWRCSVSKVLNDRTQINADER